MSVLAPGGRGAFDPGVTCVDSVEVVFALDGVEAAQREKGQGKERVAEEDHCEVDNEREGEGGGSGREEGERKR